MYRTATPLSTSARTRSNNRLYAAALERRGGLVEEKDARSSRKCAGDLDNLTLLDGERLALDVWVHVEVPVAKYLAGLRAHGAPADEVATPRQITEEDILCDRQLRDHHCVLKDRRNAAAPGADVGERRRRLAIKPNLTAVRGQQAAQDRNECRFAGAVPANEPEASA